MAKQDSNPPLWEDEMSDGCSGVADWLPFVGSMKDCCIRHDELFHYGGTIENFKAANKAFYKCIHKKKRCWFCHQVSKVVAYWRRGAVRRFGKSAFNWEGPGPRKARLKVINVEMGVNEETI